MSINFTMKDYGSPKVVAEHFIDMGIRATLLQPVLDEVIIDMVRIEKEIFKSNGRRGGGSWKRLADSTVRKKGHDTILRDSLKLEKSLTVLNAPLQVNKTTRNSLNFGTRRKAAFVHQFGSTHVPARPFIKFTEFDLGRWEIWISRYITKKFGENMQGVPK